MYLIPYLVKRISAGIATLLLSSFLTFTLTSLVTDPLANLKEHQPRPPAYIFEQESKRLMLDKSIPVRYVLWMKSLFLKHSGGESVNRGYNIVQQISHSYFISLRFILLSTVLSALFASIIGVYMALKQDSLMDRWTHILSFALYATPLFYIAILLKNLFIALNDSLGVNFIKTIGDSTPGLTGSFFTIFLDDLSHLIIPTLTLTIINVASWNLYQRNSAISIIDRDYVKYAVANGLSFSKIFFKYIVRNAIAPFITIVALDFASLISGAVIAESVFNWNGMGLFYINAVRNNDIYSISTWLLIAGATVIAMNIVIDLIYSLLNPRLRHG